MYNYELRLSKDVEDADLTDKNLVEYALNRCEFGSFTKDGWVGVEMARILNDCEAYLRKHGRLA